MNFIEHMKRYLILFLALSTLSASAQISVGYQPNEARDMIALCNGFTFLKEEGSDAEIIPSNYERVYDSESMGLDNRFQVYTGKNNTAAIVLRGTTANPASWMVNMYAAMIPAADTISIDGKLFPYKLADRPTAAVHSGYTLAVLSISDAVLEQIENLNDRGIYDFYITGHSQGGSLATLLRAYLENLPEDQLNPKNRFKTYAFAGPMVGNFAFADEYNRLYSEKQTSFRIENPEDGVPSMPSVSGNSGMMNLIPKSNSSSDFGNVFLAALFQHFNDSIAQMANEMGAMLLGQFSGNLGEIKMPENLSTYEYKPAGQLVTIEPVVFAPSDFKTAAADSTANRGMGMQHKPYTYYRSILQMYYPEVDKSLKRRIPPGVE